MIVIRKKRKINVGTEENPILVTGDYISYLRTARTVGRLQDSALKYAEEGNAGKSDEEIGRAEEAIDNFIHGFGTRGRDYSKYWPMIEQLVKGIHNTQRTVGYKIMRGAA